MNARETLAAITAIANGAEACPCVTFDGLTGRDGGVEAVEQLLTELSAAADLMFMGAHQHAAKHAAHVMILAIMTGYNLGVSDTFDSMDSDAILTLVPDTLASVDYLGDE